MAACLGVLLHQLKHPIKFSVEYAVNFYYSCFRFFERIFPQIGLLGLGASQSFCMNVILLLIVCWDLL